MGKRNAKNCWEYWNCKIEVREKCPAYLTDSGQNCWYVAGSYNKFPNCPKVKKLFIACWECPWFKKFNPNFDK
jgi:hypothetical protein